MNISEVNSNGDLSANKLRKSSEVSMSSVSDCHSDSSEECSKSERKISLQETNTNAEHKRALYKERGRSMSDGAAKKLENDDTNFEVFPSLPNSILEKLGLRGDGPREHMNEEELEQKFTSLALAFSIDAATIKDRCVRQRRSRDQTERNLNMEIEKLQEKLLLMQPLCTDYEKAELFSTIITQIDLIKNATSLASISAERFGSVQHEERLTESVGLMVSHVQMLKQQRDTIRRQLQYTKRVLQNSTKSPESSSPSLLISPVTQNRKIISQRRASIATFTQHPNEIKSFVEIKKVTRRTSDMSLRGAPMNRIIRPNRLELGEELVKIRARCGEMELLHESDRLSDTENEESLFESNSTLSSPEEEITKEIIDVSKLPFREKLLYNIANIKDIVKEKYKIWTENGTLNDFYRFSAVLCFSISIIFLLNILVEYEYAKRGFLS